MVKVSKEKPKQSAAKDAALQQKADKKASKRSAAGPGGPKRGQNRHPLRLAAKGIASVRAAILHYFREVLLPSAAFQSTFGARTWEEVEEDVRADVERFGLDADGEIIREPNGAATYIGRVYGLHTEVSVHPGEDPSVFIELD